MTSCFIACMAGASIWPGRGDQRQPALAGGLDHLPRLGVGGGHRLLHVDVLAGAQRGHAPGDSGIRSG